MRSSWQAWDFFQFCKGMQKQETPVIFSFPNCYFERILLQAYCPAFTQQDTIFKSFGKAINRNFIEKYWTKEDLFSSHCATAIFNSEEINDKEFQFILENWGIISKNQIFFIFSKPVDKFKQLAKLGKTDNSCVVYEILDPPFWEGQKVLNFYCSHFDLVLPLPLQQHILEHTDLGPAHLYQTINTLSQNCSLLQKKDLAGVLKIIPHSKFDKFKLSELFSRRQFKLFYEYLFRLNLNFDQIRELSLFMINHLLKVKDPSYISKKQRPSKYDKNVASYAKSWDSKQINQALRFFGKLEYFCKIKTDEAQSLIKKAYFKALYRNPKFS